MINVVATVTLMLVLSLTLTLAALIPATKVKAIQPCEVKSDTIICVGSNKSIIPEALKYQSELPRLVQNLIITCDSRGIHPWECVTLVCSPRNRMLKSLKVSGCCVKLDSSTFEGFRELESLFLIDDVLGVYDLAAFQGTALPSLQRLILSNNIITSEGLQNDTFSGLPNYTVLDLSHNQLVEFTPVLNQTLSGLKLTTASLSQGHPVVVCAIDYGYNHIKSIKAADFQNIICDGNLTLAFSGNSFLTVASNDVFSKFTTLGTLSFESIAFNRLEGQAASSLCNLLTALEHKTVGSLELVESSLTDQDIASTGSCFQSLANTTLNCLNISWNLIELRGQYLKQFFARMAKIESLEKLDLSANNIISGVVIGVLLTNLKFLDLSKNYIPMTGNALGFVGTSTGVRTVPRLKTLRLCRAFDKTSPLTRAPNITWFNGLGSLKTLDLTDNYLFQYMTFTQYKHFYDGVPYLNRLNLARTDLGHSNPSWTNVSYPSDTLTHLDISGSYFTDLHMPLLRRLRSLTTLILRSNSIGRLIPDWFARLGNITTLDVSDNKIAYIDVEIFQNLPHLKELAIGNNAFGCDCSSWPLAKWLRNQRKEIRNMSSSIITSGSRGRNIRIDFNKIICMHPKYGELLVDHRSSRLACDIGLSVGVGVCALAAAVALIGLVCCCANGTHIRYRTARSHMATYTKHLPKTIEREGSRELLLYHNIESDAFVCYDVGAQQHWVEKYLDNMLQFSNSMRVRLKYLLLPRGYFCSQIQEIAPTCRSILLVVDEGFVRNVWGEIRPILLDLPPNRMKHCVLVLLDGLSFSDLDKSLQYLGRKGECYKWPHKKGGRCCGKELKSKRELFWKEVRLSLRGFPKHTITLLCRVLWLWCCRGRK